MTYRVELRSPARRAISERLPASAAHAVLEFLTGPLAAAPRRVGRPLLRPFEGRWSARRGEYRVIHRIDDEGAVVYVEDVRHRRDAYRTQ